MLRWWLTLLASLAFLLLALQTSEVRGCNEAVCGSVVSKCLLTQSCKCEIKENSCSCCKDCHNCLNYLWSECCSCVEMCNQTSSVVDLGKLSVVLEFNQEVQGLFEALTAPDNHDVKWNTVTFPFDLDATPFLKMKNDFKLSMLSEEQNSISLKNNHILTQNCTVAFWDECMSQSKCEHCCVGMGASQMRWFHDGCCECVGPNCINYGINESRCKACPPSEDSIKGVSEEDMNYGEEEDEDLEDE